MPRVSRPANVDLESQQLVFVKRGSQEAIARVIERGHAQLYVHFLNTDKRLDDWVPENITRPMGEGEQIEIEPELPTRGHKRKRSFGSCTSNLTPDTISHSRRDANSWIDNDDPYLNGGGNTSEEDDIAEHQLLTRRRNFDMVNFGEWQMKTWYFSPYPVSEAESDGVVSATTARGPGQTVQSDSDVSNPSLTKPFRSIGNRSLHRTTLRSHGRTADMLAGGLNRDSGRENGQPSILWVCDRCFKYMSDGVPYEIHIKNCQYTHPPGKRVWLRGNRMIWEIDGAQQKLYCQNLALFGKLFIDVKTLFFDTENFTFYVLTEALPSRDIVIGFFSKEKKSYDDYNLACIVVLPPYQRKGFGMLLIEFSYVLSRFCGVLGTPERPLSDLGLRGYLTYWISTLIRFFRIVMQVSSDDISAPKVSLPREQNGSGELEMNRKRKRVSRMGATASGDLELSEWQTINGCHADDLDFTSIRKVQTRFNEDGSATTHVSVCCTLDDIAKATSIRPEDVAFALNECGFLRYRQDEEREEAEIVVSREMVEQAARRWRPRRSLVLPEHLHLS